MRLKLLVAYDGGPFAGWQSQPGGNTVQDILETAVAGIQGAPVTIHGSGRTDAGVHALGQVAHFDAGESRMTPDQWLRALNALLPAKIRILKAAKASPEFHARFSAKGKIYRYVVWNGPVLPPLDAGRAWHVYRKLHMDTLRAASEIFTGRHDFAAFCVSRGKPGEDTHRTIHSVRVARTGGEIRLTFEGGGFLYKMVRMLSAAIVRASQGAESIESLRGMLNGDGGKFHHVAPAGGLYLVRVLYKKTP